MRRNRPVVYGLVLALLFSILAVTNTPIVYAQALLEQHEQYRNGTDDWSKGNINITNSHYAEGESVPYRYEFTNVPPGSCLQLEIHYEFIRSNYHTFDFLTSVDRTIGGINLFGGGPLTALSESSPLLQLPIPDDTFIGTDELLGETQYFSIYGDWASASVVSIPPFNNVTASTGEKSITLRIAIDDTPNPEDKEIAVFWGGHLAIGDGVDNWPVGYGSSSITGAPFHQNGGGFLDNNCNGVLNRPGDSLLGNGDRSIQGGTILPHSEPDTGCIRAHKFNDLNENGIQDDGEPSLPGWTINIDYGDDGSSDDSGTTDTSGNVTFSELDPGSYAVSEVLESGWINITSISQDVEIAEGSCSEVVYFGNRTDDEEHSSIYGDKFNDLNGNGIHDNGEPGLEGWTIQITDPSGAVHSTTTCCTNGAYSFDNLHDGTYTVSEVTKDGWTQTTPPSVDVVIDEGSARVDFGNRGALSISGVKFNDLNGNGDQDNSEPTLGGWTIFLDGDADGLPDGAETATITSAVDGSYSFVYLEPGTYTICEILEDGWVRTVPATCHIVTLTDNNSMDHDFGNRLFPPPPTSAVVGGEATSPNKVSILAPWLALVLVLFIAVSFLAWRRHGSH
ncbi:SdrD B-like domain-containing protein [Chloroflexota bacterium]